MACTELVKRLREKAGAFDYDGRPDIACDYEQAADAIEELSKNLERSKEWETFWEKEANEALKKFQTTVASMPRWIPVAERLPKYGTPVLAYGSRGGIFVAKYERARAEWDRDYWWKLNSSIHVCNPTHWMPLPEPPMEDTDAL